MDKQMCVMCVEYEESGLGAGECRWAARFLEDHGFAHDTIAKRHPFAPADECKHFEMSSRGVDLCEEYGITPGVDSPATLHAGSDVTRVEMGGRR